MKPFSDNSNPARRETDDRNSNVSDERLDDLLRLANPPRIGRKRRRRLKKHLAGILRSNRAPMMGRADVARVALGGVAFCVLAILVSWLAQPSPRTNVPEVASDPTTDKAPLEIEKASVDFQIVSHVVWTPPVRRHRGQPMSDFLRSGYSNGVQSLGRFSETEFGLELLEQAANAIDSEQRLATRSRNASWKRNVLVLQQQRKRYESSLVKKIRSAQSTNEQKLSAFQQLCRIGTAQSFPFVLEHWGNERLEPEIVVMAKRLGNDATIARMSASTQRIDLQTELMAELLKRGSDESVQRFLELTERHKRFAIAQHCGHRGRHLPTVKLLSALHSNRLGIVHAASITLSKVDDPRITERLLKLAVQPRTRQAAVMALTARQDRPALRFVEFAARDVQWSGTVAMAQRKWDRLLAIN